MDETTRNRINYANLFIIILSGIYFLAYYLIKVVQINPAVIAIKNTILISYIIIVPVIWFIGWNKNRKKETQVN